MRVLAAVLLSCATSGCAVLAQREVSAIEDRHGVSIDITTGAALADLTGGSSLAVLQNIDKELASFPYEAKRGMIIHIASGLDILGESKTLGDVISAPLVGGATQDRPGESQGHVFVLNKGLWGTFMDMSQPSTTMWQDPHLRHELMHAYEINALKTTLFRQQWQELLDEKLGDHNEMIYKLGLIDSISLFGK